MLGIEWRYISAQKKCQFGLKGNLMGQNIINSRLNETTEKTWKCNSIALHLESIWKVSCVYNMRRRYCSRRKFKVEIKFNLSDKPVVHKVQKFIVKTVNGLLETVNSHFCWLKR